MGGTRMSGPDLIYTATSQASAAGGATQYAFVSCFGAKMVTFIVRAASGIPVLNNSSVDIDPGPTGTLVTGVNTGTHGISFIGATGDFIVVPADNANLYGSTNQRFWMDRIALRGVLNASATGVSCWAVTQWD